MGWSEQTHAGGSGSRGDGMLPVSSVSRSVPSLRCCPAVLQGVTTGETEWGVPLCYFLHLHVTLLSR